ncbi:hypothetical protein ACWX0K_16625 [Nitrobacteraceae bacterium UC4446_H13]
MIDDGHARQCASPAASLTTQSHKSIACFCQFHIPYSETREADRFIAQALPSITSDDMIRAR